MDMEDMEIPLPEELEWLEANSNFQEEAEEEFEPFPEEQYLEEFLDLEPQKPQQSEPTLPIPPKPTPIVEDLQFAVSDTLIHAKKRSRPVSPDPVQLIDDEVVLEDKRSRIDTSTEVESDEDWLRPPPRGEARVLVEEKFISRFAADISGDCMPVTAPDGERVYAKINKEEEKDKLKKLDINTPSKGLILESINVLMQRVEQDALNKALEASVTCQSDVNFPKAFVATEQLWVDKYAPNSFVELLSDEHTNREVLLWLKQWDTCVFKSEIKSTDDDVLSALRRHTSVAQLKKTSNRNRFGRSREPSFNKQTFAEHNSVDEEKYKSQSVQEVWNKNSKGSSPPEQKILLLCGPPGLGKTTLAHVAARHCGYRVVEINASDDRTSSTIEAKILDAVQLKSVETDAKPKCLVIDEIDGALGDGKGAVDVILKMVSADRRSESDKENLAQIEPSGKVTSKKKRKDISLLRPVICICNDLYAPALRPLRLVAKIHIFVQPSVSRIVTRLKYICNKEGMKTSSVALTALAEHTECDIRSCLNTLQFLNKKKEILNMFDISSQVVGKKDSVKGAFDVWKEIFQKRRVKRERKLVSGSRSTFNEFESLHSMLSNCGNHDLIIDGIHENILQLHYHDPVMQKTVKCLHALELSDFLHHYAMRTQRMSLLAYQPAIAIAVRGLITQVEKPKLDWPKSFQRYRTTLTEKMETLHSWHSKLSPHISRHITSKSFVDETISPLLHILSPPTLRPVALHLLSEKEKHEVAQLVNTMVSYSITYRHTKNDPLPGKPKNEFMMDASVLSFDPPIGEFINFKGYRSTYFVLALAVKQVLCHEVEKQKILQSGINKLIHGNDMSNEKKQHFASKDIGKEQSIIQDYTIPSADKVKNAKNPSTSRQSEINTPLNASTSAACKSASTSDKRSSEPTKKRLNGSFNFFKRFKKTTPNGFENIDAVKQAPPTMERDSRPVLFKFNEGFTNAVKRPVRIQELLL